MINGREEIIDGEMTILSLLNSKGINPSMVVVEHNYEIPDKEKWDSILINDGDNIEIVKFIGGG
ncbi:sulfur carrier protein ThiS [Clostridium sp. N3C]|uniref:sulfur carrier protein ThiS n=1 Tax=Clostridium sp. N3C TaxID=1776758 RepID=UPI001A9A5324|nr:sulfur carrier protein ThiS [Clostridium sp. N3C]